VTFDGIAKACAEAMGRPEPELVHFDPKAFDFGKKKSFPMRDQHFFASIDKAERLLGWRPQFGLVDGLRDSYQKVRHHLFHCSEHTSSNPVSNSQRSVHASRFAYHITSSF
jgi:nucleoside-diphosphate-sugar epimerase